LTAGRILAVKHTTVWARAKIKEIVYRMDVNTLHRDESADRLVLNDIGRVRMRSTRPLFLDEYDRNRDTGSLILVDEATNRTVGAAVVTTLGR
jgi:bifunctional enzyme CysN/CysC